MDFLISDPNETLYELKLEKHPDKTVMGRTEKGFDFLGYHFGTEGLSMAEKTIMKFLARAVRLYEEEQREPSGSPLLGLYVRRWGRWVRAGFAAENVDPRKGRRIPLVHAHAGCAPDAAFHPCLFIYPLVVRVNGYSPKLLSGGK